MHLEASGAFPGSTLEGWTFGKQGIAVGGNVGLPVGSAT